MTTPLERQAGLVIGTVEAVSSGEITVQLEIEAPHETALNTGLPVPFPRINNYVLLPGQAGAVVGQISWIGIERSAYPKRKGLQDFGIVDLPFPMRRLKVTPLGTLRVRHDAQLNEECLELERGVALFPSVGDPVSLPTGPQLRAIVEVAAETAPVVIGRSALADAAPIRIDPDRLFGRHLAVLGNTGSGKSCTVAGLIRWTIQAAVDLRSTATDGKLHRRRGTRFVVLDPNGEYRAAFAGTGARVRILTPGKAQGADPALTVPAWMWNGQEWASILQAAPGVQQPLLHDAIRSLKTAGISAKSVVQELGSNLHNYADQFEAIRGNLAEAFGAFGKRAESGACLIGLVYAAESIVSAQADPKAGLSKATSVAAARLGDHVRPISQRVNKDYSKEVPTPKEAATTSTLIADVLGTMPQLMPTRIPSRDTPSSFDVAKLPRALQIRALLSGDGKAAQHVASLVARLDALLADSRLAPIVNPVKTQTLAEWLELFFGGSEDTADQVVVVDLALVPSDVTHLIMAVIARILFEAAQRFHRVTGESFPSVLVLEEAHTFIQDGRDDPAQSPTPIQMCRRVFERIAREGRKFGVGLVLSSQRPSEISATVLSQCNTFLLHRLVSDVDQDLVRRLVPDTLGALLRELPVLPARHAVLLGHASPVPKIVKITELPESQRPKSKDPPMMGVWTGVIPRDVDWSALAKEWSDPS